MVKVYLDNHTATRPFSSTVDKMLLFFKEHWGSTTSPHQMGQELFPHLNTAVDQIFESLGAKASDRFYFFQSSSDAISHLFLTHYFDSMRNTGKNHILTTNSEEAATLLSGKRLEEMGCHVKMLPLNNQGQLTRAALEAAIGPRTSLVSISWANGLTGVIHPVADLAEVCQAKGVCLHVDASYVIGKLYLCFEDLGVDFLTFEGSFLHSPKGTAGLIVKEKTPLASPLSSHMGGFVGAVAAIAEALHLGSQMFDHVCLETSRLRDQLEKGILQALPNSVVFFQNVERLPNCTAIAFPGVASDALLFLLHRKGIYASLGGGHCQKLSHVLVASGVDETLAQCALSFSLSYETKEEDIALAIQEIVASVQKLQALSGQLLEEMR